MLENETFEKYFAMSTKEEGGGGSENSGKYLHLRRDAFLDDPIHVKFSVNLPFFSKSPLNVSFLYMKINTLQESIKIKSTTLLLIGFYQVENIKSGLNGHTTNGV